MTARDGDLQIRLLGPIDVVRDGTAVQIGGRRQATLLALLALEPGRVVSTDRLIDELWAGEPTDGAATTLKVHVTRLRAVLGDSLPIRGSAAGYALHVQPDQVDIGRFERLLEQARKELDGHPRNAARLVREALELWRGRPFGDLGEEGGLRNTSVRLTELHLEAIEQRIEADLALGRSNELVAELEALVAAHPYRERFWRQLMLALYRADRQADALAAYHRARAALDEQLGVEPGQGLRDLEAAILRQEVPPAANAVAASRSLPHPISSFLGRSREIHEIHGLASEHRLVTLIGPGGVGKTRLAIEAVRGLLADDEGATFVDLALVSDPADVVGHVARAIEIPEAPGRSSESAIVDRLADERAVLLFDNCEHVRDAVVSILGAVLAASPEIRVVATSREVLGVPGEVTYAVGPLGVGAGAALGPGAGTEELPDAVALFVARLREARPGAALDPAAIEHARAVCVALDGLPLAIELAASRGRVLSLAEISKGIADRFRFLVSWRRVTTGRHRTLREAMDWSYDLLAPDEQAFLRRSAVFVGGFTLRAASAVSTNDEDATLHLVSRLVDASLLTVAGGATESRYQMLETVRQFAIARSDADEQGLAADRHAAYYLSVAEALHRAIPSAGGGNLAPLRDFLEEDANLRVALRRVEDADDPETNLRFAGALWRYWWLNGLLADGRAFIARALARDGGSDAVRVEALRGASSLALRQGDVEEAAKHAREALDRSATLGEATRARAQIAVANAIGSQGETATAAAMYAEAADAFRRLGLSWDLANALLNTADVGFLLGDLDLVERAAGESLATSRSTGDDAGIAVNLGNLAFAALERGAADRADALLREALERSTELNFREWMAIMIEGLGAVAAARGADARAAQLLGAAARIRDEIGASLDSIERRVHEQTMAVLEARLGETAFHEQMAAGRSLSNAAALALANATPTDGR